MFKHYLTTALRHFGRHKTTSVINGACLALGLICFLAAHSIATLLNNSDQQFANADRIYAVTQKYIAPGANMSIPTSPLTVWPVGEYLKTDIPELEAVARLTNGSEVPVSAGATKTFAQIAYADATFFTIFDWQFVDGDAASALTNTRSLVLTEATAIRLFGDATKAVGKTVLAFGATPLTVTGVIAPLSGFSHMGSGNRIINFDMLAPMSLLMANPEFDWMRNNWNSPVGFTYALLPDDGSLTVDRLRARLKTFDDRYVPKHEWQAEFDAVPLSRVMVSSLNAMVGTEKSGISIVQLLYGLGIIVLLISALNYANLATAQGTARAKEIGLRRVVGATRKELVLQYVGEALLMSTVAAVFALVVITAIAATLQNTENALLFALSYFTSQLPLVTAVIASVGLVAGAYPAFILSGIPVAEALRSRRVSTGPRFLPAVLVGVQFAATSFLIIVIFVMTLQHKKLEQAALNNAGDPVVVLSNDLKMSKIDYETLRTELLAQPHVKSVTGAMHAPWVVAGGLVGLSTTPESTARRWTVLNNRVQLNYLATMDIPLLAGREFDASHGDDFAESPNGSYRDVTSVIVDRALAEQNGWTPDQAVGKQLYLWIPGASYTSPPLIRIIGVAENKPLRLLGLGATSGLYMLRPKSAGVPIVRISGQELQAGLKEIDAVWEKLSPDIAIKRRFADEILQSSMSIFLMVSTVIQMVSVLALTIAVLGLIGMSLHIIGRRTHEIGVRKSLGASVRQVLVLLLRDFSKPVLIANLVAWPLAFAAMSVYLSIFVTRTSLSFVPFIGSLLLTLAIAWLAVGLQAVRAARMNPATVLRYE